MLPGGALMLLYKGATGMMMMMMMILIHHLPPARSHSETSAISARRCVVWGVGLDPNIQLPVRYFYIQAVQRSGENITHSLGADVFQVKVSPLSSDERLRVHVPPPQDRNDGSYLVRFRLYSSALHGLKVEVLHQNTPVAQSPYILPGPVYHEDCDCPYSEPSDWLKVMKCPDEDPQIQQDFSSFPSIDLQRVRGEVPKRFYDRGVIHYSVVANRLHRRTLGRYTDFKMFSDEMLLSLMRKVRLPDLEFFVNVGDWPLENRGPRDQPGPVPIVSWCGSAQTRDIVLPTYDLTHSTLETMRGVSIDVLSVQGNTGPAWQNKSGRAFFRGRDSREERLQLAQMSREHPELLDAGITAYFFFREREKDLGKAPLVGFFHFFKYKYQVNVDGTVAAYRFPYLMLGDSVVLKQDSPYYEHFYTHLDPDLHYIPINRSLSDLIHKIQWAQENDSEAQKIARAGQAVVRELLQPHRLYCYYYMVLQRYSERQVGSPELHPDMEEVPQPSDPGAECVCDRRTRQDTPRRDEL